MKKYLVVGIILLLIGVNVSGGFVKETKKISTSCFDGNTLYVGGSGPNNYTKIQDAIDDAISGDKIYVYSGIYYENVIVNKTLNLIGEDRDNTMIDGGGIGDVVYVTADSVNISGFTIQNSGPSHPCSGINSDSNFNCFSYNNIFNNLHGIYLGSSSNSNTIKGNNASNNNNGIHLSGSNGNMIIGNSAKSNNHQGIRLYGSSNNTIRGNNATSNINNIGIYLVSHSNNNMITCNNVLHNDDGIRLATYSNDNIITGNIITNLNSYNYGIRLDYSHSNTIAGNNASNNFVGILIFYSHNNLLYHNNLINNSNDNACDFDINLWYNSIIQEGNYYDDYTGEDLDGDGIGDTPYDISGGDNQDIYPLMEPWGNKPPSVEIINPKEGFIHISGVPILPTFLNLISDTISIGGFRRYPIIINATDDIFDSSELIVKVYLNGELQGNASYCYDRKLHEWFWTGPANGIYDLTISAEDSLGDVGTNEMTLYNFCILR